MRSINLNDLDQATWSAEAEPSWYWYELDGRRIFQRFTGTGTLRAALTAVMVVELPDGFMGDFGEAGLHHPDGGLWYTLEFPAIASQPNIESFKARVQKAVTELKAALPV